MILATSALSLADIPRVGSKAAFIGEMRRMGIHTSPGVALTSDVYTKYLASISALDLVHNFWRPETTHDEAAELSKRISKLLNASPPISISAEILAGLKESDIRDEQELIVRSSATCEDSARVSFAGQFASIKTHGTTADVADALIRVWASATLPHVRRYLSETGQLGDDTKVDMSVLIQQYIDCEIAGLFFTHHPTLDITGWGLIECAPGGAEPLVAGSILPWRARVNLDDHRTMIESGNFVDNPLTEQDLATLIDYGQTIYSRIGNHVDMEWGKPASGSPTVVAFQCRPMTVMP